MPSDPSEVNVTHCIRTLRLKVKREAYTWLHAAASEVNRVWNFSNETSAKAARPFVGPSKWLSAYDLDKLTAGAADYFERIGSATIQRVNAEFATRRKQFKKTKLRWRSSRGSRRAPGWLPFKAEQLKRKGKSLRFSGKAFRVFEYDRLSAVKWKSGCFAQDAVGDWWLSLPVEPRVQTIATQDEEVGLDLGLKDIVATGDGDKLELAGRCVLIVGERNTTKACNNCHALTGPTGLDMLSVRSWVCGGCGVPHDRDVNAARNIRFAVRSSPSMSGNESSPSDAPPSQASRRREAGTSALTAAA